jgi:hypothetical protein
VSNRTAVASGADPVHKQAALDTNAFQDAYNLVAITVPAPLKKAARLARELAMIGYRLQPVP